MEVKTGTCFICGGQLGNGETVTVKDKGFNSLRAYSERRKDGKFKELTGLNALTVHVACRKTYTRAQSVEADLKRSEVVAESTPSTSSLVSLRSKVPEFEFAKKCLFCAQDIPSDYLKKENKKPIDKRIPVYNVRTITVKDSILDAAEKRSDVWGQEVKDRIIHTADLVAADAQYHQPCFVSFFKPPKGGKCANHPSDEVTDAMNKIFSFIESGDECQFTMTDLINSVTGYVPTERTIKKRLIENYGDDILISVQKKKVTTICFRDTGYKILTNAWYNARNTDDQEERLRIVRTAAEIVREDIRSKVYDTTSYPPSNDFLQNLTDDVPESLDLFLKGVVSKNRKGDAAAQDKKCVPIAHAIIAATRPRSFLSPLQLALALFLYRRFGSKNLVSMVSNLGFCASYKQAQALEISAVLQSQPIIKPGLFCQFVFDNADCNVNTIDGSNTFHSMGGIACITPSSAGDVAMNQPIPKVTSTPSAADIGKIGMIPLKSYEKAEGSGLRTIKVKDLQSSHPLRDEGDLFSPYDLIWIFGKLQEIQNIPGWRGFMETVTRNSTSELTRIRCLPFINSQPSKYDTIYTTLLLAVEESRKAGLKTTIVTFDQPLYVKARDIVAACRGDPTFDSVIIRLGGFHLLMSYLGAIGYVMAGSGLKELLSVICAPVSVDKMLTGHAYARAVRGHLLAQLALAKFVVKEIQLTEEDRTFVREVLSNFKHDPPTDTSILENPALQDIGEALKNQLRNLERNGPTARLWIQYFRMINIMKNFIQAERSGDWYGHLRAVQEMLPYFHASGHFPYAKSAQMYLQDMLDLESRMNPEEFKLFVDKGFFTIRRTTKFWSGTWSDMTIEQSLMRPFSVHGGLTRGRGYTDSVQSRWILGMPATHDICEAIEEYGGISFVSSEQHVDCRDSRISKDQKDITELEKFFSSHPPFPIHNKVVSISTGVVGDKSINCYKAGEVGKIGMKLMIGNNFKDVKLKRTNRVLPLATGNSAIKVHDKITPIDPLLLFHRLLMKKETDEELIDYLQYELAPFPLSLLNEAGLLKTKKSIMYDIFEECEDEDIECTHVIDGGFLLHRVVWQQNQSFASICTSYITYVRKHYGSNSVIVFDGYSVNTGNTKQAEQQRRGLTHTCADVHFDENMTATVAQEKFLANSKNKERLITMLAEKMTNEGYMTKQAVDDADSLIIQTAIEMSSAHHVTVIGEDVDLLILLVALAPVGRNIHFVKPGKGNVERKTFSSRDLQVTTGLKSTILFLHAFGGCDTTSCFFRKGKLKCFKLMKDQPFLREVAETFNNADAMHEEIALAGQRFVLSLYGAPITETSLNKHRYNLFAKAATHKKVDLASLPPTEAALRQHSFRVYHQVQKWLGHENCPELWGWKKTDSGLVPVPTTQPAAPDSLLHMISCNCKKGCTAACGCRKAGLKCSVICGHCLGVSCHNAQSRYEELEEPVSERDVDSPITFPRIEEHDDLDDPDSISVFHAPQ